MIIPGRVISLVRAECAIVTELRDYEIFAGA
jgi:hypothetical protein